jgi:hypothetical protein
MCQHYLFMLNSIGRVVRSPFCASIRQFSRLFDFSAHTKWRKGKYINESFLRRRDAEEWALDVERWSDRGEFSNQSCAKERQDVRRSRASPSGEPSGSSLHSKVTQHKTFRKRQGPIFPKMESRLEPPFGGNVVN